MSERSAFKTRKSRLFCGLLPSMCGLLLLTCAGCAKNEAFGVPTLQHDAQEVQVQRATRFDPYPDPNIGPEIHGARPYGFDDPSSERIVPTRMPN